ncbi:hypothetical protein [Agrobacterium tumefaciens]|uniref:hypothetical protein n=1 Tax=Agrobacterium tumefaciens TaxID=358 RepID=UPI0021D0940B|nr:hypothetical protein [Agrobacterium tumefaciens]UXS05548.1 hypothetical protein FY156_28880 [Agrobacterium tumefaciens]
MRPEISFEPFASLNCCTDLGGPNWCLSDALEINGCVDVAEEGTDDSYVVGGVVRDEAEFFTVYGHLITSGCVAITNCSTLDLAEVIAVQLSELSGLTVAVHC